MDIVILNNICKFIDDAKTLFNFALCNKLCRKIFRIHEHENMERFTMKTLDYDKIINKLPSGIFHGLQTFWYTTFTKYKVYYKGEQIVECDQNRYDGLLTLIRLTVLHNEYVSRKLELEKYRMISSIKIEAGYKEAWKLDNTLQI